MKTLTNTSDPAKTAPRVAIIGGGPGGLMTAYLLNRRAPSLTDITIFEADLRVGGKIVTKQFDRATAIYEAGTAELYDYSRVGIDPLRQLVTHLGLPTRPLAGETVVLNNLFLKTDADVRRQLGDQTWKALQEFRRQARSLISPLDYYESDWKEAGNNPLVTENFDKFLSRIPDRAARRCVEIMVHSDVATEPEHTNAMYGLQNYLMNDPDYMQLYTIVGGIERLPKELARRTQARILINQPVVRVEATQDGGYRILSRSRGEVVADEFDFVVAALPNNWLLNIEWAGSLADVMRRHHARYDHVAHYLRVSILFKQPFWRHIVAESYFMLDAFGGCCVYDESSRHRGNSHGVLGWLLAGEAALTMSNFNDDALIERVLDSIPPQLGYRRQWLVVGRVHRWVGSVNGLPGGCCAGDANSRHLPDPVRHSGLLVVGDYLFDSTLNGLFDSADLAAEHITDEALGRSNLVVAQRKAA